MGKAKNGLMTVRRSRGISRNDLAAMTGVSKNTIIAWEVGKRDIQKAAYCTLKRLAEVLCTTIEVITGEDIQGGGA